MKFIKFDEIKSTNDYMKENIEKFENYDIVSAKNQTLGRGRKGNTWVSTEGMALFSFVLKSEKKLSMKDYTKLPLIAGISTLKALEKIEDNKYKFKWTNDVYLENKKLCGILIEKVEDDFVIGIGINVNNTIPEVIKDIAIALNRTYDIDKLILKVVEEFYNYYEKFITGQWLEILAEINYYNLLKGKEIKIRIGNEIHYGKALNIAEDGRLEVQILDTIKLFSAGEIKIEKGFV